MKNNEMKDKIEYYEKKLNSKETYWDKKNKELIEFKYMGQTGFAVVCEPGDSGAGMQSSWLVNPENLERIVKKLH